MRTTAIMNLKGGTGKTVTTINAAAILAQVHEKNVLAIDADSQASLTEFLQRGPADGLALGGMSDLLRGMRAMATHSKLLNVDLLPADETLMALDISAPESLYVTGTVVQVHEDHRWFQVEYENRNGKMHECFKF